MKQILALLPRPSHYLGIEEGSSHKSLAGKLHVALAFPDLYEVGMSYLGQKILYGILNARPDLYAERVFAPCREAGALLQQHQLPLASLESDTALKDFHLLGFAITHELCYTNVLYMLDLAQIPLYQAERDQATTSLTTYPIVVAGGGCAISSLPLAPFFDLMLLGEGEDLLPELCDLLTLSRIQDLTRQEFFREAMNIPGVFVPSLQSPEHKQGLQAGRRVVADLNAAAYPIKQVVPLGAVHNRLSLEIARGCTRGCRFCQAGILYRPCRERDLGELEQILKQCLDDTGFDEVSFLSLSTGDFSGLKSLFLKTKQHCVAEQISVSLPSLRVGSIDEDIMQSVAEIRRTGATLAPEAGSQRLRDVINKGITEAELLDHVQKLHAHGWQTVKLYFMIGLPTETDADLDAIVRLAKQVRDIARPKLQVTVSISPFVPKPFTPFQWEASLDLAEMNRRIYYLRSAFRPEKFIKMRWHEPGMSYLESVLARGGAELSEVIFKAYKKNALFTSWADSFSLEPWLEALAECQIDPDSLISARDPKMPLPWDHLQAGVSRDFLLRERQKALQAEITPDCRYASCQACGACDTASPSLLPKLAAEHFSNRLNFAARDQGTAKAIEIQESVATTADPVFSSPAPKAAPQPMPLKSGKNRPPEIERSLVQKALRYRIWHKKVDLAAFISQLELQSILERACRRAGLPLAFSQGFHPLPLMSFGRALPVGVESLAEWFSIILRQPLGAEEVRTRLNARLLAGLDILNLELIPINDKSLGGVCENFNLEYTGLEVDAWEQAWQDFWAKSEFLHTRDTKKGERTTDLRPLLSKLDFITTRQLKFTTDWSNAYFSPLNLVRVIAPFAPLIDWKLTKTESILI